eukprot:5409374-Amphidinium_carterae.1
MALQSVKLQSLSPDVYDPKTVIVNIGSQLSNETFAAKPKPEPQAELKDLSFMCFTSCCFSGDGVQDYPY